MEKINGRTDSTEDYLVQSRFLQNSFLAPIRVGANIFEFQVNQQLESLACKPTFSAVTTVIQAVSSKFQKKVA
ncbi:hypothetical protein VP01_9045g1 [Puccinia sorghi]|uniref:Uncharacterized protein n=1 Tax=Puccinia sorghi TaxID=27349 RepID=A0A0L6U7Q7_9BASI|nr:hypothetical protein VP01_9045g1 [Puccinia sorghi]